MASTEPKPKRPLPAAVPLPADALDALRRMCSDTKQVKVAEMLGVSEGTVSNALKGRYIGRVDRLAERIRGVLLDVKRECPVLGPISTRICQDEREKPFHSANPTRVQLWRACRVCPHNPKAEPAGTTAEGSS